VTVGRLVHYMGPHGQVLAAIVAQVHGEGNVTLSLFNQDLAVEPPVEVPFASAYTPGCWSWPSKVWSAPKSLLNR